MAALRGDISFRYLKQFILVSILISLPRHTDLVILPHSGQYHPLRVQQGFSKDKNVMAQARK
jgi:hypothetical protein